MGLAPSTIRSDPKKYGAGHKLLIDTGLLLNSIGIAQTSPDQVMLSTNVKYAAVQRFGSRDRDSIGFGPRTRAMIIKEDSISLLRVAQTARIERRQEELLQREVDSNVGDLELEIRDREFSIPLEGTVS
jgi:phage gpG-like protein